MWAPVMTASNLAHPGFWLAVHAAHRAARARGRGCAARCIAATWLSPIDPADSTQSAIVLSGGPASIYEEGAIRPDAAAFTCGVPVLGLCYGQHSMAHLLGGTVEPAGCIASTAPPRSRSASNARCSPVPWRRASASGCRTVTRWGGFPRASPSSARPRTRRSRRWPTKKRRFYGIQFHPEVRHTELGRQILDNFLTISRCGARLEPGKLRSAAKRSRRFASGSGDRRVIVGLSGGVDSTVTTLLCREAVTIPFIFVDTALSLLDEADKVELPVARPTGSQIDRVNAAERFFTRLAGAEDPEEKRRRIGHEFIAVFEEEATPLRRRRLPRARDALP